MQTKSRPYQKKVHAVNMHYFFLQLCVILGVERGLDSGNSNKSVCRCQKLPHQVCVCRKQTKMSSKTSASSNQVVLYLDAQPLHTFGRVCYIFLSLMTVIFYCSFWKIATLGLYSIILKITVLESLQVATKLKVILYIYSNVSPLCNVW